MKSEATTVDEYLRGLPPERREAMSAVRAAILANLPRGYEERMSCGMIGFVVPHSIYPAGYHCDPKMPMPFASLASQKNYMTFHLMTLYGDKEMEAWFRKAWSAAGKKLDMGKACVRFSSLDDVSLEVIGQAVARTPIKKYIGWIAGLRSQPRERRSRARA